MGAECYSESLLCGARLVFNSELSLLNHCALTDILRPWTKQNAIHNVGSNMSAYLALVHRSKQISSIDKWPAIRLFELSYRRLNLI